MKNNRFESLKKLQQRLCISFNNVNLLNQALCHTSYANELKNSDITHNERLEFLGDAVLDLIIAEYVYKSNFNMTEGELSKIRSHVVCEQSLASAALSIDLGEYLLLGKGETISGGRMRNSILADSFEALIGALYLDQGFEKTIDFVINIMRETIEGSYKKGIVLDYKTHLQELIQKGIHKRINYEVIAEEGPDHDKRFTVRVLVNDIVFGIGVGKSKKEAEQMAAQLAIEKYNEDSI